MANSYLEEIAEVALDREIVWVEEIFPFDNTENLYAWYLCHDEFPFEKC